jgi:MYXO-CTERM domain-containing protein
MSKSGYVLALVVLTAGVSFAGCIVEYDGNEAGAGASTGGKAATGGATSKGGGTSTGTATSNGSSESGCSVGRQPTSPNTPLGLSLVAGLALASLRRRQRRA